MVKTESFSSKIRNKTKMFTLTSFIQHSTVSPSHSNQGKNKRHPNWKGRNKTFTICRRHETIIENPEDSTGKLLELINEFGKITGHKINIQKYVVFL